MDLDTIYREIPVNKYQTPVTKELLQNYPEEVVEQFYDCMENVEFIKRLVSPDRRYAKDCPRDDKGRIIVDLANPHILENVDYFRQPVLHYIKHGCYTFLKPNSNPHSEYRKFWEEERRRCWEGYVRESDGEWVTGFCYWMLNYNPMMINKIVGNKRAIRVESFPLLWEGMYWRFHYLEQAKDAGKHAIELARRGCGKSYALAAIMSRNLILGLSSEERKRTVTALVAAKKEYLESSKDGSLSKFIPDINFVFSNTPWPSLRLKKSSEDMTWVMGYKDANDIEKGTFNTVMAISAKDDTSKTRGKRGWILFEEMGSFSNLLSIYDVTRKGVEDGDYTFSTMYLVGTSSEKESDFSSAKTLLYGTEGYNIYSIPNVFDKPKQGKPQFGFFFPSYINRQACYNKDGVSDVVKALLQVLVARHTAKYSADPQSVLRVIAEDPITPAEAIIRVKTSYFPVTALTERLQQLDSDNHAYDDVHVGTLVLRDGKAEFKTTDDEPIRKYGVDNSTQGALEIFEMPQKNRDGNVFNTRYIVGLDPVNNDQAESSSLCSMFVFDLFTDRIVAEFTGRLPFADDNFEMCRMLCLFYNARCLYEAHPYDQKVYTPDGVKLWGDIKIGDSLFSPEGKPTKVIDIPIDGEDDIYELTFNDGRKVQSSSNHVWSVFTVENRYKLQNIKTYQLLEKGLYTKWKQKRFFVPECKSVVYPHKDVPIEPYTLGLLIAEGAFTKTQKGTKKRIHNRKRNHVQLSACKEDAEFYKTILPYPIKYIGTKGYSWHLYKDDIGKDLENLGLLKKNSHNKFIPDLYMFNDYNTRLELLRGLMDGDGCATKNGASVFITTSRQLADDVLLLCRSLGIKANENKGMTKSVNYYKNQIIKGGASYRIAIHSYETIFKLPRKANKQHVYNKYAKGSKAQGFIERNAIVDIKYIGRKKCKCVTVDNESGLYLIGDYVVTHNCNNKGAYSYFAKMNSLHLLADTPEYLRDKQLVKYSSFGSSSKGVNASAAINNFANNLIRDWLLQKVTVQSRENPEETYDTLMLYTIRNRALIEELIAFNPEINVDRIRALGMVMIYREEKIILYQGRPKAENEETYTGLENDSFFTKNYNNAIYNKQYSFTR